MKKFKMKIFILTIALATIAGAIVIQHFSTDYVGLCSSDGGCWDYIRNRCEYKDQGYCEKDELECAERNGKWQADKSYCIIP